MRMMTSQPRRCQCWFDRLSCRRKTGNAQRIGFTDLGAAAHIVTLAARHQGRKVFAFTRPGDANAQSFALRMGAEGANGSDTPPPERLDAAIIFAIWAGDLGAGCAPRFGTWRRSGVCGHPHERHSLFSAFAGSLALNRHICSVANLTRRDAVEFLEMAPRIPVQTETRVYPLAQANEALPEALMFRQAAKCRGAGLSIQLIAAVHSKDRNQTGFAPIWRTSIVPAVARVSQIDSRRPASAVQKQMLRYFRCSHVRDHNQHDDGG